MTVLLLYIIIKVILKFSISNKCTYSSNVRPVQLKNIIDEKYQNLTRYMDNNKLKLNSDKTHLMILTSDINHRNHDNYGITLNTGNEIILPQESEMLLGGIVSNDLKWKVHILNGIKATETSSAKKSLISQLTTRLNALRKVSTFSSFKVRKMIGNGIFMSKIVYLIQLWGGCSNFLLKILQKLQNKAARIITKSDWNTKIEILLNQCGWLSIRQLVSYHSLLQVYKTKQNQKPEYFYKKFSKNFPYRTRFATGSRIKQDELVNSELGKSNFTYRAVFEWNELPTEIRQIPKLGKFKKELKQWIRIKVPLE